jgi:hypothetical protein
MATHEDEQEAGTGDVYFLPEEFRRVDETGDRTLTALCMFACAEEGKDGKE